MLLSLVIFVIGAFLSAFTFLVIKNSIHRQQDLQFQNQTNQITSLIKSRISDYSNLLIGAQGLFEVSPNLTNDQWQEYGAKLNLNQNYSGITAISYIKRVYRNEVGSYQNKIYPFVEKDQYFPATYAFTANQQSNVTPIGFDVSSDAKRNQTLQLATDNNQLVATPIVLSIAKKIPSFIIYAPIYDKNLPQSTVGQRRTALTGIVSASFQIRPLFQTILSSTLFKGPIDLKIFDSPSLVEASGDNFMFDSNGDSFQKPLAKNDPYKNVAQIMVGGRTWTLYYSGSADYEANFFQRNAAFGSLVLGMLFGLLLAALIYSFAVSRQSALEYAEQATQNLKLSRDKLAKSKAQAEAMLLSITDGLVATDIAGNIIFINKPFEEILGWKQREVLGRKFTELVPMLNSDKEFMPEGQRLTNQVAERRIPINTGYQDFYYIKKDHSTFPVSIAIAPIVVENEVIGTLEIFRDVTKEKQIDKAKTEFVSLAGHQLNTPLTAIRWHANLLLKGMAGELQAEQNKYLQEIYNGTLRMIDIVRLLLNVSRLDLGAFALEPEMLRIEDLCDQVISELRPEILAKSIQLEKIYAQDLKAIKADRKLANIIIQNLLDNAVKYTPAGGRIKIEISNEAPNLLLKISDNGHGIPKDQHGKIFSKLFRADNAKKVQSDGSGLGLYLVKSIIDQINGNIWFESEQGKGTTFYVIIPSTWGENNS